MPSRIGLVIGCIGGTGRKSVEESGREWVGGVNVVKYVLLKSTAKNTLRIF